MRFCLSHRNADESPEKQQLRRKTTVLAASAACIGGLPAVLAKQHHPVLMGVLIAIQITLLAAAMTALARARRS